MELKIITVEIPCTTNVEVANHKTEKKFRKSVKMILDTVIIALVGFANIGMLTVINAVVSTFQSFLICTRLFGTATLFAGALCIGFVHNTIEERASALS